jgi:hypothetical protein
VLAWQDKQADNARQDEQFAETKRHNKAGEDEARTYHGQENALSGARLGLDRSRLGIEQRNSDRAASTPGAVVGRILAKQAAGQALTPAEQQALSTYKDTIRSGGLLGDLGGDAAGGDYGQPAPPRPPARPAPPAQRPASPLPPQALSALRPGQNTRFANGQVWTLRNGQPARVQ